MSVDKFNFRVYPYYNGDEYKGLEFSNMVDDWALDVNDQPYIKGQYDAQELIQSFEKECDINNIVAQHVAIGDLQSLSVDPDKSKFVDISNVPDDLNTLNAQKMGLYKIYNSLNADQKALFTDFEDFIQNSSKLFKVDNKSKDNNAGDNGGNGNES